MQTHSCGGWDSFKAAHIWLSLALAVSLGKCWQDMSSDGNASGLSHPLCSSPQSMLMRPWRRGQKNTDACRYRWSTDAVIHSTGDKQHACETGLSYCKFVMVRHILLLVLEHFLFWRPCGDLSRDPYWFSGEGFASSQSITRRYCGSKVISVPWAVP